MTESIRDAAIRLLAENQLRRYDNEFDASHLHWRDFEAEAREDLDALAEAGLLRAPTPEPPDAEDERLAVYEQEREDLAAAIVKAVNGQYIGKPPPLLTGWHERTVSAVLAAGWLPPTAVQERIAAEAAAALANQTALKGMTADEGALVLELGPPRELVIAWVDAARKMLGGAENYSETRIDFPRESVSMEIKAAGEFERYVFTVQRAGKMTPHEARRAAETEVEQLRARLAGLEACDV